MMKLFKRKDINQYVKECLDRNNAVLLDVRERNEFQNGHIEGAVNLPLSAIETASFPKDTPLYVYCLRGSRSRKACAFLRKAGYTDVMSIGGIVSYKGTLKR